jgi:hypothetical protein
VLCTSYWLATATLGTTVVLSTPEFSPAWEVLEERIWAR